MIGILGTGSALGSMIRTNEEVCRMVPVTPEWIVAKTGILTRCVAAPGETVPLLALEASRKALDAANVCPEDISTTIVCTFTHEYLFPAAAMKLHHDLGLVGGYAYDMQANCSAFVAALVAATDRCGDGGHALVVGAEVMSPYLDLHDTDTTVFLADGAGAAVIGPSKGRLVSSAFYADTSDYETVRCRRDMSGEWPTMEMYGVATGRQAIKHLPPTIHRALDRAGWDIEDVDLLIFHQANLRLIEFLMQLFKLPMDRTYTNVAQVGNTGAASIPIALDGAMCEGRIRRGAKIVLAGVGAGFGFSAACLIA